MFFLMRVLFHLLACGVILFIFIANLFSRFDLWLRFQPLFVHTHLLSQDLTLTSIHQSARAGAASQGLKITQQQQAAPLLVVRRHRALHRALQAGHLRTRQASSHWPSSSISTTTSTSTRTRTNTSRPSYTPQLLHRLW